MWLGGGRPGRWTDEDLLLLAALTAHEDQTCTGCGQPKDKVYGADGSGFYERKSLECAGCATLHAKRDSPPGPGEKTYLEWVPRG